MYQPPRNREADQAIGCGLLLLVAVTVGYAPLVYLYYRVNKGPDGVPGWVRTLTIIWFVVAGFALIAYACNQLMSP